jgi:uncharacterized protein
MKINQDLRTTFDRNRPEIKQIQTGHKKFIELVEKQGHKLHLQQLNQLMTDLEEAGNRLARSRTFKDLTNYKRLVKRFIREAVDFGMELKQSHSWTPQGQSRMLKIVEQVDEKLLELTEEVIHKEKQHIDILGKIGEIKGLLINLYT